MLPGALHLDADSGHTPFSRAGSRNHGAALAMAAGADVIVVCDADTIPEPGPLHAAIGQAATDGRLHTPDTRFLGLTEDGTRDYLSGRPPVPACPPRTRASSAGPPPAPPTTWPAGPHPSAAATWPTAARGAACSSSARTPGGVQVAWTNGSPDGGARTSPSAGPRTHCSVRRAATRGRSSTCGIRRPPAPARTSTTAGTWPPATPKPKETRRRCAPWSRKGRHADPADRARQRAQGLHRPGARLHRRQPARRRPGPDRGRL